MKEIDAKPTDYRRTTTRREPVFVPGAWKRVLIWVLIFVFAMTVALITSPLGDLGYWLSCNFITGTCRK